MKLTGNTILITGGGSGIGRGLAEAFQKLGNEVHIVGRRQSALDEVVAANPGIRARSFDVDSAEGVAALAEAAKKDGIQFNVLINNAGIMRHENWTRDTAGSLATAEATISTNLLGPMRLTAALLPILTAQPSSTVINVTSGLAFMNYPATPAYAATKAAIHAWSQSLRWQLRDTQVDVLELVPPYVQTELNGPAQATDPNAMPLQAYIDEVMQLLGEDRDYGSGELANEILVKRVLPLRWAERDGAYDEMFRQLTRLIEEREKMLVT